MYVYWSCQSWYLSSHVSALENIPTTRELWYSPQRPQTGHPRYRLFPRLSGHILCKLFRLISSQANVQGGADGLLVATDLTTGERIARYSAHYGPLNSLAVTISGGKELILTGGDDGIARVWDLSMIGKDPVVEFDDGRDCPVTAVEWSGDGNQCFVGGVDNEVKVSLMISLS